MLLGTREYFTEINVISSKSTPGGACKTIENVVNRPVARDSLPKRSRIARVKGESRCYQHVLQMEYAMPAFT